jgi:hypothetical protein
MEYITPKLRYLVFQSDDESVLPSIDNGLIPGKLGIFLTAVFEGEKKAVPANKVIVYFRPDILNIVGDFIIRVGKWTKSNRGKHFTSATYTQKDLDQLYYSPVHCITIPFIHSKSIEYYSERPTQHIHLPFVKFTIQTEWVAGSERPIVYSRTTPDYYKNKWGLTTKLTQTRRSIIVGRAVRA